MSFLFIEKCKRHYIKFIRKVTDMATKSIFKDVNINNESLARTFVEAVDKAENIKRKKRNINKKCIELKGNKIKDFFSVGW